PFFSKFLSAISANSSNMKKIADMMVSSKQSNDIEYPSGSVTVDINSLMDKNPETKNTRLELAKMVQEMADGLGMTVEEIAELTK
ncbi:MAG: hypothetical protein ABW116_01600, partial [Candidatus Sedimenticola sp. 20ELBAFRAG]